MLLSIYLNDHLAGATVGRELSRRTAASNRSTEYGPFLSDLARQLDEDRDALIDIMRARGARIDQMKVAASWAGEKLGRLKLNGRLRGYSPLSRVVELEGLTLGVNGKLALWRSLKELGSSESWGEADLDELIRRAETQLEGLETHRLRAIRDALG